MEDSIFPRKVASMACVLCLSTSDLPDLKQSMNRSNEHLLNLSESGQVCWRSRSWVHIIGGLMLVSFLADIAEAMLHTQIKPFLMTSIAFLQLDVHQLCTTILKKDSVCRRYC